MWYWEIVVLDTPEALKASAAGADRVVLGSQPRLGRAVRPFDHKDRWRPGGELL